MLKKTLIRGLAGVLSGIGIGHIISVVANALMGTEKISLVSPILVNMAGSEFNALVVQILFSGLIGFYSSALSIIWELDHWSLAKQTGVFAIGQLAFLLPIAFGLGWVERNLGGFLGFTIVYFIAFFIIWIIMRFHWKYKIDSINKEISKKIID